VDGIVLTLAEIWYYDVNTCRIYYREHVGPRLAAVAEGGRVLDSKSPVGPWNVAIQLPAGSAQPTLSATMEIKINGKKSACNGSLAQLCTLITGTFAGLSGPLALAGVFVSGNVAFTVTDSAGAVQATFSARLNDDGALFGVVDMPEHSAALQMTAGLAAWSATRPRSN
jgi:hypothetical protein